jgi:hypothetical protein
MDLKSGRISCVAAQPSDLMLMLQVPHSYLKKMIDCLDHCVLEIDGLSPVEQELSTWFHETMYPNLKAICEEFEEGE